jgi:hypothetical protein
MSLCGISVNLITQRDISGILVPSSGRWPVFGEKNDFGQGSYLQMKIKPGKDYKQRSAAGNQPKGSRKSTSIPK